MVSRTIDLIRHFEERPILGLGGQPRQDVARLSRALTEIHDRNSRILVHVRLTVVDGHVITRLHRDPLPSIISQMSRIDLHQDKVIAMDCDRAICIALNLRNPIGPAAPYAVKIAAVVSNDPPAKVLSLRIHDSDGISAIETTVDRCDPGWK